MMEVFVLRTAAGWERANGAAVILAESLEGAETLMRDHELEERLTCYQSEAEAQADVTGPSRHIWVQVERFPNQEEQPRVVIIAWDDTI